MEYLIIKAVVANTLKEMKKSIIILKDLIKLDNSNESLAILLSKAEHLSTRVKISLDKLNNNKENYKNMTDKQDIMDDIDFDTNFIRNYNDIKNSLDTISYKYISHI